MSVGTLGHIPRYMGRMSNNNKMLINNSSWCFTIRIVYTRITVKWGIWYIDKGFLIWIISSMYLFHEAVIWVILLVLLYLLSLGFNLNFWFNYYYIFIFLVYHLCTTPLISYYYHIVHSLPLAWYYTCITVSNLLTCLFMTLYGFFSYRMITAS